MSGLKKLFEKLYTQNAPSWSVEQDEDGSYKYHATKSAFVLFESQQCEIEQLKAKNEKTQKQFNFLLDKNIRDESEHATLKLKFMEVSRLVRSLRNEFDLNSDCSQVDRQIELLEEALRGGDQNTKNKAQGIENIGHEGGDQKGLRGEHE